MTILQVSEDPRAKRPYKFDDREGRVDEGSLAYRRGIREHIPGPGNRRFRDLLLNTKGGATIYYVERNDAQLMANGRAFFVQRSTIDKARNNPNMWVVGVDTGSEATSSPFCGLLKHHEAEGSEVPRRRWPHNAMRFADLERS